MATAATICEELARHDDPSVDRALAAALPTADPQARAHLVHLLLERGRPEGCVGLVLFRHLLEPDLQRQVDQQTLSLSRAIRQALRQRQSHAPVNAVRMIRAAKAAALGYLVTEQLRAGDEKLAGLSAECLRWLSQHAATCRIGAMTHPPVEPHAAGELRAAIEEALVHYPAHQQRDVLVAMCELLPQPLPRSTEALGRADHAATQPMRALLAEASIPAVRRALIWALGVSTLVEPAMAGLRRCCAEQTLGEALESAHLLALTGSHKAMLRHKDVPVTASLWPDEKHRRLMPTHQQSALPAWAAAISRDPDELVGRLTELAGSEHARTRLAALRRLLALAREHPQRTDPAIARFLDDDDADVARLAVWHILHRKGKWPAELLTRLVNSRHERIRTLASRRLAPIGFERMWDGWAHLSPAQRLACGRALVKIDPHFHRQLGERLAGSDRAARLRALSIISDLHQGVFFTTPLTQLARSADEFVAASAVMALGSSEGEEAVTALRTALHHADARVRANAVEALAKLQTTDHVQDLVRMATRDENRPRANAIGALMSLSAADAMTALHKMLHDPRPAHRASALWLVEQLGLLDAARDVAEMAVSDPDDPTRRRADRVVRGLMDQMHQQPPRAAG